MEGKELNEEALEELNFETAETWDNQEEAKTVFTLEEVEAMKKELLSNSERWVQKVISKQKLYEKALEEVNSIADDWKRLVEIYDENPDLANIILGKFFDWEDIEAYKSRINYAEDYTDPKIIQKKIKEEAEKLSVKSTIEREKQNFIDKMKMSWEEKENFDNMFNELRELKSFRNQEIIKQFEKAYRLWNDNEELLAKLKNQEFIWKSISTQEGKTSWKKTDNWLTNEITSFLTTHKVF